MHQCWFSVHIWFWIAILKSPTLVFIETKGVDVIVMLLKYTLPENDSKSPWK